MSKPELRVDWATHEAAKYACENWHYTGKIPVSKLVKIGAWEDGQFIGIVLFGMGASAQVHKQFGVSNFEVCDLVRVAFKDGHKTPCSRIIAIALKFLKRANPGLRVCVSFADPEQNHHGGIYQAGNWIFTGRSAATLEYYFNGDWRHVTDVYKRLTPAQIKTLSKRKKPGKLRYVMPFDDELRTLVNERAKPYLKREDLNAPEAKDAMRGASSSEKAVTVRPRRSKKLMRRGIAG